MTDTLTVIAAWRGRLAKKIRADGVIEDYDSAFTFDLLPQPVASLDDVLALLRELIDRPKSAVVRGVPIDRWFGVRRLAHADPDTGDQPTLRPASHEWLALDLDGVERPETVPPADLIGCATSAIQRLPSAFHGARCIVQASASHGIKPGCRLRLWYWLDRPTDGDELKRWLRAAPVDPSVFRTVQPIYTSGPVFEPGVPDHLPERIAVLPGRDIVAVPSRAALAPPAPRSVPPMPAPTAPGSGRYAFSALTNAAVRARHAGIGQRHDTILREAQWLARFVEAGLLNRRDVNDTLRRAGSDAGKPDDEIDSILAWAAEHPSKTTLLEGAAR